MIIKNLHLAAFGKFKNKRVELKEGLNLICGPNEAGKTTIHKFIEGMFFGFFKPYSKNKIYTPLWDKYRPWDAGAYSGSILYEYGGKQYRLERSFDKNGEYVKLFDDATGSDLTESLEFDPAVKLPKANKHLNINSVLFRNTVSIGQLSNVTDEDLAKELGDLLVNTQGTLSDISYKSVLENLEKQKAEIGTAKQAKSPYGKSAARLEELTREKQHYLKIAEENKSKYADIQKLNVLLDKLAEKKGQLNADGDRQTLARSLRRFNEYRQVQKDIAELKSSLREESSITSEAYDMYMQKNAQYQMLVKNVDELESKRALTEQRYMEAKIDLEQYMLTTPKEKMEEMKADTIVLNQSLEKIAKRRQETEEIPRSDIHARYVAVSNREKIFSVAGTVLMVLAFISAAVGYLNDKLYYFIAAGLGAAGLGALIAWGVLGNKRAKLEPEYERYETTLSRTYNTIIMYEIDVEQLKKKYKCADVDGLKDALMQAEGYYDNIHQYETAISDVAAVLRDIAGEQERLKSKAIELRKELAQILFDAGVTDAEQMKQAMAAAREREVVKAKLAAQLKTAGDLLENKTVEQLEDEARKALSLEISPSEGMYPSESNRQDTETVNNEIMRVTSSVSALKAAVSESESLLRPLGEIEEDILLESENIKKCERELAAYELAVATIEGISEDIHSGFSQSFNDCVSRIIKQITQGKYAEVKVNNKMEIMVVDAESNRLAPVSSLSGGTIDQLYFAVRFAIMDLILPDKTIPVFLDDCFLQYDEQRLENILQFIKTVSKRRQIIMFSCRNAEKAAMDKNNIPYHFLELKAQ